MILQSSVSRLQFVKVEPVGVEPTPSWSQTTRAPICTSARKLAVSHETLVVRFLRPSRPLTAKDDRLPAIQVVREALESSSPGLQPSAIPSQLPDLDMAFSSWEKVVPAPGPDEGILLLVRPIKKPDVCVTPGFCLRGLWAKRHVRNLKGRISCRYTPIAGN